MQSKPARAKQATKYQNLKDRIKQNGFLHKVISNAILEKKSSITRTKESIIETIQQNSPYSPGTRFEDGYELAEIIGHGANAAVRRCIRQRDGQTFAVKISRVDKEHLLYLRRLFSKLSTLTHPNLITYREMFINLKQKTCHLVMDHIMHPNLSNHIYNAHENPLAEKEIQSIMNQLFKVLSFLHASGICHRDVKPDNILYDRQNQMLWLIDFGVSKLMIERGIPKVMMTNTGTCEYKAPEIFEGGAYSENIDMWAAGVVLYQLVEKHLPFFNEYMSDTIQSIIDINYTEGDIWRQVSRYARDLLHRLLKPALRRLSAQEALKALWFNYQGPRPPVLMTSLTSTGVCPQYLSEIESKPPLTPLYVLRKSPRNLKVPEQESPIQRTYELCTLSTFEDKPITLEALQQSGSERRFHLS